MRGDHPSASSLNIYSSKRNQQKDRGLFWPNGIVPYEIAPCAPNQDLIINSIRHIVGRTRIRFVKRCLNNSRLFSNYLVFTSAENCESATGMQGGRQPIALGRRRNFNTAVYLILNALGFKQKTKHYDECDCIKHDCRHYQVNHRFHPNNHDYYRNQNDHRQMVRLRQGMNLSDIAAINALYSNIIEPPVFWHGVQFQDVVGPNRDYCWLAHSWPCHWFVHWSVVSVTSHQSDSELLDWSVRVEKQSTTLLKYFIDVKNLSDESIKVEARYTLLG